METVRDIMTKDIVSILPSDTVEDAAQIMAQNDIGSVPVVYEGELKGLLTDRDIVLRCVSRGKSAKEMKVSDLMTTDIAFLTPDQTLYDAANIMAKKRVRRLPVLNKGYIDGMVSLADIARFHKDAEIASALCEVSIPTATSSVGSSGRYATADQAYSTNNFDNSGNFYNNGNYATGGITDNYTGDSSATWNVTYNEGTGEKFNSRDYANSINNNSWKENKNRSQDWK